MLKLIGKRASRNLSYFSSFRRYVTEDRKRRNPIASRIITLLTNPRVLALIGAGLVANFIYTAYYEVKKLQQMVKEDFHLSTKIMEYIRGLEDVKKLSQIFQIDPKLPHQIKVIDENTGRIRGPLFLTTHTYWKYFSFWAKQGFKTWKIPPFLCTQGDIEIAIPVSVSMKNKPHKLYAIKVDLFAQIEGRKKITDPKISKISIVNADPYFPDSFKDYERPMEPSERVIEHHPVKKLGYTLRRTKTQYQYEISLPSQRMSIH